MEKDTGDIFREWLAYISNQGVRFGGLAPEVRLAIRKLETLQNGFIAVRVLPYQNKVPTIRHQNLPVTPKILVHLLARGDLERIIARCFYFQHAASWGRGGKIYFGFLR